MTSEELQRQQQARERMMAAGDTPEKRLERLAAIQMASMQILKGNPAAYQEYLKRNYAARRAEYVDGTWKPVARS